MLNDEINKLFECKSGKWDDRIAFSLNDISAMLC